MNIQEISNDSPEIEMSMEELKEFMGKMNNSVMLTVTIEGNNIVKEGDRADG